MEPCVSQRRLATESNLEHTYHYWWYRWYRWSVVLTVVVVAVVWCGVVWCVWYLLVLLVWLVVLASSPVERCALCEHPPVAQCSANHRGAPSK
jgi:hypothetical protein